MDNNRSIYIAIIFTIAVLLFLIDIYYYNYNFFYDLGISNDWVEQRLIRLNDKMLFLHSSITRSFVLILTCFAVFLSKVKMKITDKEKKRSSLIPLTILLSISYTCCFLIYDIFGTSKLFFFIYISFSILIYLNVIFFLTQIHKMFYSDLMKDRFTKQGRKFDQFKHKLENEYSVNIPTEDGWVNIVNPFRASQVLGTPGSGKSYSFLIEAIIQMISKGYAMLIYDFKYPDLSLIAYNALQKYKDAYDIKPDFCVINFDDIKKSNRCNPLQPELLLDTTDAIGAAQALMYGLYPKWAQKQGEFFTESSINFVASCIWALKKIDEGRYCSVPHLIQLIGLEYDYLFTILSNVEDEFIKNIIAPFLSAWKAGASDQLEGQIGTTRIALSRLTSPYIYYIMTDDFKRTKDFNEVGELVTKYKSISGNSISLQINDPKKPKILCLANNPDKQLVYAPLHSLYNTRLMRLVNKKNMLKTGMFFDELPTLSFPPGTIDNLIATARSNKIAVFLGFQDFAQLRRDLGKEIAEAIINTVGNTFSGMVNFDTAKQLSDKFGKIKIEKESVSISKESTSVSLSTEMQELVPASEISSLEQGVFVGQVADDRGYEISQKIFYSKVLIDHEKRKTFEKGEIPDLINFDKSSEQIIQENQERIISEIQTLAELYSDIIEKAKNSENNKNQHNIENVENRIVHIDNEAEVDPNNEFNNQF